MAFRGQRVNDGLELTITMETMSLITSNVAQKDETSCCLNSGIEASTALKNDITSFTIVRFYS